MARPKGWVRHCEPVAASVHREKDLSHGRSGDAEPPRQLPVGEHVRVCCFHDSVDVVLQLLGELSEVVLLKARFDAAALLARNRNPDQILRHGQPPYL
jgi:hypothetical protein